MFSRHSTRESNMAEHEVALCEVCGKFSPQQWRPLKCKMCFNDVSSHKETSEDGRFKFPSSKTKDDLGTSDFLKAASPNGETSNKKPMRTHLVETKGEESSSSNSAYQRISCDSSSFADTIDVSIDGDSKDFSGKEGSDVEDDDLSAAENPKQRRRKYARADSFDGGDEDKEFPSRKSSLKKRTIAHRRDSTNLIQISAMMRSSNSSLCSYNSEGLSDFDYDIQSVTDTDDYAELGDSIPELESAQPEVKAKFEMERRISRTRIFDLEKAVEGIQDEHRAIEIAKDRQIKSLQREVEGLKLELSSVKAHENIALLKSRLELESKTVRVSDLESEVRNLQTEIERLSSSPDKSDVEDVLSRELDRAKQRILALEEETRSSVERLALAEDLQKNDRELLDVLRNQLSSLENDLFAAQQKNRLLEDKLKILDLVKTEFRDEQEKGAKLTKEVESLRQKIKRRDRHIEDLEDDNVRLKQLKTDLETQLGKRDYKLKRFERKVSELQTEVSKCNKEIADLTGEKRTLEQVRRLTDQQLTGADRKTEEERHRETIFINSLEERLKHTESRAKELELENDNFLKEMREMFDTLVSTEKQFEELKETNRETETKHNKLRQENRNLEKRTEMLQRKLQKTEKERRKALARQSEAEKKLAQAGDPELQQTLPSALPAKTDPAAPEWRDAKMLALKLQSTEAKLTVIEGNKSYLEAKLISLERKMIEREQEISRLHDSLERDSGLPSHDSDRYDALERENSILHSRLEEVIVENMEQKDLVTKLKENNANLDATIQNLGKKLEKCSQRLKDVEEANHLLGREALRRSQSLGHDKSEVESTIRQLREENSQLAGRVVELSHVEQLVEHLQERIKTERSISTVFSAENETMKLKISKMADTIRQLEDSKADAEKSLRHLCESNRELDNDVKRLEQKLEIYGELFGQDASAMRKNSLERHGYYAESDHEEERMLQNALAPLMQEIQEKDMQIKRLELQVLEKDKTITTLMNEVELLEANLSTMISEKIRGMNQGNGSEAKSAVVQENCTRELSIPLVVGSHGTGMTSAEQGRQSGVPLESPSSGSVICDPFSCADDAFSVAAPVGEQSSDPAHPGAIADVDEVDTELTISQQEFYYMLDEYGKLLKMKDERYFSKISGDVVSSSESCPPLHAPFEATPMSAGVTVDSASVLVSTESVDVSHVGLPDSLPTATEAMTGPDVEPAFEDASVAPEKKSLRRLQQKSDETARTVESFDLTMKYVPVPDPCLMDSKRGLSLVRDLDRDYSEIPSQLMENFDLGRDYSEMPAQLCENWDFERGVSEISSLLKDNVVLVGDMYDQIAELESLAKAEPSKVLVDTFEQSQAGQQSTSAQLQDLQGQEQKHLDPDSSSPLQNAFPAPSVSVLACMSLGDLQLSSGLKSPVKLDQGPAREMTSRDCLSSPPDSSVPNGGCTDSVSDIQLTTSGDLSLPALPRLAIFTSKRNSQPSCSSSICSSATNSVDLSMLDDLLSEVNSRSGSFENLTKTVENRSSREESELVEEPSAVASPRLHLQARAVMPSIRTTKRRIFRIGSLERTASFDTGKRQYVRSSVANSSSPRGGAQSLGTTSVVVQDAGSGSQVSSCGTASSQTSVMHIAVPEISSDEEEACTVPPLLSGHRRQSFSGSHS